ncbi:hypothetical protein R5W23_001290 [Gemmata sp. JC673]|uniref:J domain-containing protein n=1 Tax=Gemmata algarum TaxID=2975278 RepID=A0ABU5EXP8_9BACT|nr:hypothetical protein [Gemmata algarum]MDY3560065.1 hypothetical protein [Gemmata algarum]
MELGIAIRGWLGLPPGVWPPDHYALLGFAPGEGDVGEIEARVLDRMELLRPHQIRHPEAVTEGMNRLAQALVCLTDPVTRAAYDRHLGIAPAPFEVVDDEPIEPPLEPAPRSAARLQNLPYEVVADDEPFGEVLPDERAETRPVAVARIVSSAQARRAPKPPKLKRRTIYRRLAALRRVSRAWDALRPVLGTPGEPLATPVAVFAFLQALTDARVAFPGAAFVLGPAPQPGGLVLALVREASAPGTVRGLLPSQREAVAQDWHRGHVLLQRERAALRKLTRRLRRGRTCRAQLGRLLRAVPELVLVLLAALLLLGAAIVRHR